ncbi:hypothetical protein ACQP1G_18965 [Nocardia sp. CA-107356]|uniref:hypothetical protein n=1 Tax=Nocardia sp. CA-107356 TaxID=3239972 RepID=UPI003D9088E7
MRQNPIRTDASNGLPAEQDPAGHAPNSRVPRPQPSIQRDPLRHNPINADAADMSRSPNRDASFSQTPQRHSIALPDPIHHATASQDPMRQNMTRAGASNGELGRQGLDYQGDWSDWVDEPAAEQQPPAPDYFRHEEALAAMIDRSGRNRSTRRWLPVLVGSVAAAGLLVVAFVQLEPNPQPATVASSSPSDVAVAGPAPAPACPAERVGSTIQGNGAGGMDSGPAVIFAFQYAYYVTRSGEATREFVAPNASVSPATTIQQGIDGIPVGTTHCLTVTPGAAVGQYLVQVTEHRPDSTSITYKPQAVTTARVGSQTLISGISVAK